MVACSASPAPDLMVRVNAVHVEHTRFFLAMYHSIHDSIYVTMQAANSHLHGAAAACHQAGRVASKWVVGPQRPKDHCCWHCCQQQKTARPSTQHGDMACSW